MSPSRARASRAATVVVLGALLVPLLDAGPAEAADGRIDGAGSTWVQPIVAGWIADVFTSGVDVVYAAFGSSYGKKSFAYSVVDFALADIPYLGVDDLGQPDTAQGREYASVPVVGTGVSFVYRLEVDGTWLDGLRLSDETLTRIFTGAITSWTDPAIVAENPGPALPDVAITPVVRADPNGSTKVLTEWFDRTQPDLWRAYFGADGSTSVFPRSGAMVATSGSDGVMNMVRRGGNGTIGYVESSYPHQHEGFYPPAVSLRVAQVRNPAGDYVAPTAEALTVALASASVGDPWGGIGSTNPGAYPLPYFASMLVPTGAADSRMTTSKRQTLVDFATYSLCAGQHRAAASGYAPLPPALVQAGFEQLALVGAADPGVDMSGASCSSDALGVDLTATVPTAPGGSSGSLTLVTDPAAVPLAAVRSGTGEVHGTAALAGVEARDTRTDDLLTTWEVNAQVAPFTGSAGTVGAQYLGWTPALPSMALDPGSPLQTRAGPSVASRLSEAGSAGLGASALLARATAPGRGTTTLGADLALDAPAGVAQGTYTSTLTITLVSS